MKPFKFPLESIRVLRQQKERAAQQRYARALAARDEAEARLQSTSAELTGAYQHLAQQLAVGVSASQVMGLRAWCTVLEIRRHESRAALENARRAADVAFKEMVLAVREREALDRFYEKSRLAYEREAAREEQSQLDEMAIQMNGGNSLLHFAGAEHLN
jgi:flagellar export protein FliJ